MDMQPFAPLTDVVESINASDLTRDQRSIALTICDMAFNLPEGPLLASLSGYAGTGKTYTIGRALQMLQHAMMRIVVAAPTHKAVSVLQAKLGQDNRIDVVTIHSLLGLVLKEHDGGWHTTEQNGKESSLRDFDLAIIDEASMIDDDMLAMIFAGRGLCKILFVGDPAQLSPVRHADGRLSKCFDRDMVPAQLALTQVMRQADANPILRVATMLRHSIAGGSEVKLQHIANELHDGDHEFLGMARGDEQSVAAFIADAVNRGIDVRALVFTNSYVERINSIAHEMLYPGSDARFSVDEIVMAQESFVMYPDRHERRVRTSELIKVRNSQTLRVLEIWPGTDPDRGIEIYSVRLELEGGVQAGWVMVPVDINKHEKEVSERFAHSRQLQMEIDGMGKGAARAETIRSKKAIASSAWDLKRRYAPIRHSYAMTVHKSQGSTFEASVLYWPSFAECKHIPTRNRLAYVALTRTSRFTMILA